MTARIGRAIQAVGRPVIFAQYLARRFGLQSTVFPRDAGSGTVPGGDPYVVVVVGEATAVGFGVLAHELGMAGHLARQLSRRTGRGVAWRTRAFSDLTIHTAAGTVRDRALFADADVVLVMVGVGDSIRLTPQRTWRRLLGESLDAIGCALPAGGRILVSEVPPLDESAGLPEPWRTVASRHGRLLDRVTADVLAHRPRAVAVPFPADRVIDIRDPDAAQASRVYASWARACVTRMLGPVSAPRDGTLPAA